MAAEKRGTSNIGVMVLAAGSSSRLGKPKQSLLYNDKTLLQHAVHAALTSGAHPVMVVLGADADSLQNEIDYLQLYIQTAQ